MPTTSTFVRAAGLSLAALSALSVLPSCSTKEIAPDGAGNYFNLPDSPTDETQARFALSMAADADTFEEQQILANSRSPQYNLKIDGRWAVIVHADGTRYPVQLYPGGIGSWDIWMPVGSHVFELVDPSGKTALTTPAYDLQANQGSHLVVYGPADARLHRFFTYALDVPAGMVRYNVINLVRSGETIQVVKCDAPGSDSCPTSVSDPLAYGDVAVGDVAADPFSLSVRLIPATAGETVAPPSTIAHDLLATQLMAVDGRLPDAWVFAAAPCMVTSGAVSIRLY